MSFSSLIGQEALRGALKRSISTGTVSQATLLAGPPGSGKKTWAKALAQALLCRRSRESSGEPCLDCRSCRLFDSGNHPNFLYLEPGMSFLKLEQLRKMRGRFYLACGPGELKICMIAEADRMTEEACSALLKVLEEPPDQLIFILTSSRPDRLLPTVASRCRRYMLLPLSGKEIELLLQRCSIAREGKKATLIARYSGGLPGLALAMAGDQSFNQRLQEAKQLLEMLTAPGGLTRKLLRQAALLEDREDLLQLLELFYLLLRDQWIWSLCREERLLIDPLFLNLPHPISAPELEMLMETANQTISRLALTNVNRRLALEGMFITLQRRMNNVG